ncbi:phage tail tape measure protein [Bacillus badius]|uniref:phage tail tape measure protein n=1 Tax=Bacillus badius TaxID=1455 RepID=UPI0005ADB8D8|nr:phage tail tape measure protein [Bacillus badius]KIL74370.1 Phage tail length tape-measure protein [Bacillus badius]
MELFRLLGSVFIDTDQADQALNDTEQRAHALGASFKNIAGKMAGTGAAIAGGIGLIGGALLSSAMDSDSASAQIQASLGYTKDQADALVQTAKGIYKDGFGESLEQVSQDMISVKEQMQGLNDAELGGVTQQAMVLAKTMDEDVGAVARSADMLMTQFGISSNKAFDLLAVGQQKGLNFSGEFLDSINEYSVHFKEMGYTAEEAFAIMVSGSENGAFNLDKVGDAVKENFLRLSDMGKGQAEVMNSIGLSAEDVMGKINAGGESAKGAYTEVMTALAGVKDETERNRMGVELFGTQWEDVGQKVVMAMNPSTEVLGQVEGAAKRAGDAIEQSVSQQATAVWREFKGALEPLGQVLLKMAQDWMPKVSSAVKGLSGFFSNMSPTMQKIVVGLGLAAGALGVLLIAISPIITMIGTLIPLFATAGITFGAIAAPIGIAIAAITALVAAGVFLYKNWDEIWAYAKKVFGALSDFLSNATKTAGRALSSGWQATIDFLAELWDSIVQTGINTWNSLGDALSKVTETTKDFLVNAWNTVVGTVSGLWSSIVSTVSSTFSTVANFVQSFTESAKLVFINGWSNAKEIVLGIWSAVKSLANSYFSAISKIIRGVIDTILAIFNGDFSSIPKIWESVFGQIKTIVLGVKEKVIGYVKDMIGSFSGLITKVGDAINKVKELIGWESKTGKSRSDGKSSKSSGDSKDEKDRLALGTKNFSGGLAVVGEQGREIVSLPAGSQVIKNRDTEKMLRNNSITQNLIFNNTGNLSSTEIARKAKYAGQTLALTLNT